MSSGRHFSKRLPVSRFTLDWIAAPKPTPL